MGSARARSSLTRHGVSTPPAQLPAGSLSSSRAGLSRQRTHLWGSLPSGDALTSDPARHKVFQLEVAHGRGRGASRSRSRVGAHSGSAGHGPRASAPVGPSQGRGAPGRSSSTPGSEWLGIAKARGPPGSRSKRPRAADITPPVDLKGAARGPGEGVSTGSYDSSLHLLRDTGNDFRDIFQSS